jgi:hypothetical protein
MFTGHVSEQLSSIDVPEHLRQVMPRPKSRQKHSLNTSVVNTNSNHLSICHTHISTAMHMAGLHRDSLYISLLGLIHEVQIFSTGRGEKRVYCTSTYLRANSWLIFGNIPVFTFPSLFTSFPLLLSHPNPT